MSAQRYMVIGERMGRWPYGYKFVESDLPEGATIERLLHIEAIMAVPDDDLSVSPEAFPPMPVILPPPDHEAFQQKLRDGANKPPPWISQAELDARIAAKSAHEPSSEPVDVDAMSDAELDAATKPKRSK